MNCISRSSFFVDLKSFSNGRKSNISVRNANVENKAKFWRFAAELFQFIIFYELCLSFFAAAVEMQFFMSSLFNESCKIYDEDDQTKENNSKFYFVNSVRKNSVFNKVV